jgi:hypothetical protein
LIPLADTLKILSNRYLDARAAYEDLRGRTAEAKEQMEYAEQEMLSYMADIGIDSLKTDDGVGFSLTRKASYGCLAENRPLLLNMLEAEGYRDMFTISPQTLSALMKEKVAAREDGEIPPEYADIVYTHEETKLSVRGRKKG